MTSPRVAPFTADQILELARLAHLAARWRRYQWALVAQPRNQLLVMRAVCAVYASAVAHGVGHEARVILGDMLRG